jgi:hypothetical protein
MDNIAWLVPVLADGQGPQGSIIGVAIPLVLLSGCQPDH